MRIADHTKQFRKDYKHLQKSGRYNLEKLHQVLDLLIDGKQLEKRYYDHPLRGEWQGCRDCHIESDLVLIYELGINDNGLEVITFHRTGKHSNLFE